MRAADDLVELDVVQLSAPAALRTPAGAEDRRAGDRHRDAGDRHRDAGDRHRDGGGSTHRSESGAEPAAGRASSGAGAKGGGHKALLDRLASAPMLGVVTWRERDNGTDGGERGSGAAKPIRLRVQLVMPSTFTLPSNGASAQSRGGGAASDGAHAKGGPEGPWAVRLLKIGWCTSAWREWHVLHRLEQCVQPDLLLPLLSASPGSAAEREASAAAEARVAEQRGPWEQREKWRRLERAVCASERLDEDQQRVVREASAMVYHGHHGFLLVQGPPGTGKTTLLRALLNVLHNAATQGYYEAVLRAASAVAATATSAAAPTAVPAQDDDLVGRITAGLERTAARQNQRVVRRGRILVCAQSNTALDELLARLLRLQCVDEYGSRYMPNVVRIGHLPGTAVRECSLKHRATALAAAAMGADGPTGVEGRTAEAQAFEQQQLKGWRAQCEREQRVVAARRATYLGKQRKLQERLEAALDAVEEQRHAPAPAELETLRQRHAALVAEDGKLAARLIELQLEIDSAASRLRSMDCCEGSARSSEPAPASPPRTAVQRLSRRQMRSVEHEVLDAAHIVFCTLSGAGEAARLADVQGGFETVIFDEAAQAAELATLIPLQFGAKRVVLIGDPQQLPATVLSLDAKQRGYDVSLFERLQRGGHPSRMLRTQYRMHPAIREFPSAHFYGGKLRDGECVLQASKSPPGAANGAPGFLGLQPAAVRLAPYTFFNLLDGQQQRAAHSRSLRNDAEARFCVRLILGLLVASDQWSIDTMAADETRRLADEDDECSGEGGAEGTADKALLAPATFGSGCCCAAHQSCVFGGVCGRVAVLTPYKDQKRAVERELAATFGSTWEHAIEVASVDAFQGKEKDVVLYSCVRSGRSGSGLGFVKDLRRLNVALTRARHALYVVGSDATLQQSSDWRALISDAKARGLSRDITVDETLRMPLSELLSRVIPSSLLDGSPLPGDDAAPRVCRQASVELVRPHSARADQRK